MLLLDIFSKLSVSSVQCACVCLWWHSFYCSVHVQVFLSFLSVGWNPDAILLSACLPDRRNLSCVLFCAEAHRREMVGEGCLLEARLHGMKIQCITTWECTYIMKAIHVHKFQGCVEDAGIHAVCANCDSLQEMLPEELELEAMNGKIPLQYKFTFSVQIWL